MKIAAHSVDHMFSLCFVLTTVFVIVVISCFGFDGWVWVLIASVPEVCIIFNFSGLFKHILNRFKDVGYNLDIMLQTACLVFLPNHGLS